MGNVQPVFEEKVKRVIRDAMALDPILTQSALLERLEERFQHRFDSRYIKRLTAKVMGQAQSEIDRAKLNPRLATLRETHRMARERLLRILYWTKQTGTQGMLAPLPRDQVEAAKNLVMLDIAVLNAEVANGLYKSEAEAAEGIRYAPMPPEHRQVVLAAFVRWGMLPPEQVERIVPALQPSHGNQTTQPAVN